MIKNIVETVRKQIEPSNLARSDKWGEQTSRTMTQSMPGPDVGLAMAWDKSSTAWQRSEARVGNGGAGGPNDGRRWLELAREEGRHRWRRPRVGPGDRRRPKAGRWSVDGGTAMLARPLAATTSAVIGPKFDNLPWWWRQLATKRRREEHQRIVPATAVTMVVMATVIGSPVSGNWPLKVSAGKRSGGHWRQSRPWWRRGPVTIDPPWHSGHDGHGGGLDCGCGGPDGERWRCSVGDREWVCIWHGSESTRSGGLAGGRLPETYSQPENSENYGRRKEGKVGLLEG